MLLAAFNTQAVSHKCILHRRSSVQQPHTRAYVNAYWTRPAAHSADCNLRLWNSIPSASATRGAPLGYFLFKLLSFLLLRPIFKVAATYNSERDPLTSATRRRRNPAKRSPDFYVHPYPVVETHGRPFYHALHFRTHLRPNWLR